MRCKSVSNKPNIYWEFRGFHNCVDKDSSFFCISSQRPSFTVKVKWWRTAGLQIRAINLFGFGKEVWKFWATLHNCKVKVKWSRYRPSVAQRVGRGIALLFHDRGTRRGWVVSSTPRHHFTPGKTRYPFYRRLGGPQGLSGRAENLVPTGIRSWTVQPVAQSLYRLSYRAHT